MGMDVSSHSYIGFPVEISDFVTEKETGKRICGNGHPAKSKGKFCDECGVEFGPALSHEHTTALTDYAAFLGMNAEDLDAQWWPDDSYDDPGEADDEGVLGFFDAKPTQCSEDDAEDRYLIMGVSVAYTSSNRSGDREPAVITHDQITALFTQVATAAKAMGFFDRPIGLYTCTYFSV